MNDKIEILYTDNEIVIAVKPSGVNSTDIPGGMPELLRTELNCQEIRTVHRLDQTVSGLMLFSRSRYIARKLSEEIGDHRFHKEYLAVIHGQSESDHGIMEDYLNRNREERKTFAVPEGTEDSQYARLRYQVIGKTGEDSLVRIKLDTGRTHQIRCQFSSRGLPIAGDRKYSQDIDCGFPIALWSYQLAFQHPVTGKRVVAQKNPPQREPWMEFSLPEIKNEITIF